MTRPQPDLDAVFSALGNATRRAMVRRLASGPATVSELAEPLGITLPAVSRHVGVLEEAGLLTRERQGRHHVCSLGHAGIDLAREFLDDTRAFWEGNLDALAAFVEQEERGG